MNGMKLSGHCLCGSVRFTAAPENAEMGVCHMGVNCGSSVKVEGEGNLGMYVSSEWGVRCFCKLCGSTLFWRMRKGGISVISAQAFDRPADFVFKSEIFIDEKPASYAFANETRKMTDAKVMAMFAPKS